MRCACAFLLVLRVCVCVCVCVFVCVCLCVCLVCECVCVCVCCFCTRVFVQEVVAAVALPLFVGAAVSHRLLEKLFAMDLTRLSGGGDGDDGGKAYKLLRLIDDVKGGGRRRGLAGDLIQIPEKLIMNSTTLISSAFLLYNKSWKLLLATVVMVGLAETCCPLDSFSNRATKWKVEIPASKYPVLFINCH